MLDVNYYTILGSIKSVKNRIRLPTHCSRLKTIKIEIPSKNPNLESQFESFIDCSM